MHQRHHETASKCNSWHTWTCSRLLPRALPIVTKQGRLTRHPKMNPNTAMQRLLEQGNASLNRWSTHKHKQIVCRSHRRNLFSWFSNHERLVSQSYSILLVLDIPCRPELSESEVMTRVWHSNNRNTIPSYTMINAQVQIESVWFRRQTFFPCSRRWLSSKIHTGMQIR